MSDGRHGFRGAWAHRRWRWLLVSYAVSLTGDFLSFVALSVFLFDATGSAGWIAVAAVVRVLSYVVLGPLGGVAADRLPRRGLMISLDVARGAVMGVIAAVAWAGGPPALVVALTVVASICTVPYRPAAVAATPVLVAEDDLAAANAAEGAVGQMAFFAGPALGAAVVALADAGTAFALNAATFVVSALLIARAGDLGGGRPAPPSTSVPTATATAAGPVTEDGPDDGAPAGGGVWADVRAGAAVVRHSRGLVALVVLIGVVLFQVGLEQVVHVVVAEERLGMGADGVGLLDAAMGLGGLAVAPFTVRLARARASGLLLAGAGVVTGVPLAALAVVGDRASALVLLGVQGVGTMAFEVLTITLLQRACPERALARVYGLTDSLTAATQVAGSAAAPLLVRGVGLGPTLWLTGAFVASVSAVVAPSLHRESAAADDERRRLAPVADRLRRLGLFGDASQAALERLARAAQPVEVRAGAVVFTEGDAPGDLYVVVDGALDVDVSGRGRVSRMGPDDWFGEIGLLRGVPRTATVVAATDAVLWAVPGRVFVDAVAGSDALPDPLRRTMAARLVRTHPTLAAPEPATAEGSP